MNRRKERGDRRKGVTSGDALSPTSYLLSPDP
jgi:hypothetical protein